MVIKNYTSEDLFKAVEANAADLVREILLHVDVNSRNSDDETPLSMAARLRSNHAFDVLLLSGANVMIKDNFGHDADYFLQNKDILAEHKRSEVEWSEAQIQAYNIAGSPAVEKLIAEAKTKLLDEDDIRL